MRRRACLGGLALLAVVTGACDVDDDVGVTLDGSTAKVPDAAADAPAAVDMGPPGPLRCHDLPRPKERYRVVEPFPDLPQLEEPVAAYQAPGDGAWWYVIERAGRLKRFENKPTANAASIVIDLSARVELGGDTGLLALAFHPRFAQNGELFLSYTAIVGADVVPRVARFRTRDGGKTFAAAEEVILEMPPASPSKDHLSCDMHFGPDGMLYLAFGDGGFDGDQPGYAQNLMDLRGKFLRIDVDHPGHAGQAYAVPGDNPFVGQAARPEIWAFGFRNPWRWRFDRTTGVIWTGDVGEDLREEIDRVVRGGNHGWGTKEGTRCTKADCTASGLVEPVVEYGHTEGLSVTAGAVYRGKAMPSLAGRFVYGDWGSGHVWALPADQTAPGAPPASPVAELILDSQTALVSFAEGVDGELLLVDYAEGRLVGMAESDPAAPDPFPQRLSQSGCFDEGDPTRPAASLVPYEVNAPLWSDDGAKNRWLALPPGQKISVLPDGDLFFPVRTTLVKEFLLGGKRVETRLFTRHADGRWAGYTYEWNEAQTDATLVPATSLAVERTFDGVTWRYPTRWQCLSCHTEAAGYALGLELAQLDRSVGQPAHNQLDEWQERGLFATMPRVRPPALAQPDGVASIAARARAYLHANCAGCHRSRLESPGGVDLRYSTRLADTNICETEPASGWGEHEPRVVPGQPELSSLLMLMRSTEERRMPPIGRRTADPSGTALVEAWIRSLTDCNQ